MRKIPNIDPEKVNLYGRTFLNLVQSSQRLYKEILQGQEDRPHDPNHQNVISISSDDDFGDDADLDELANDGYQDERSQYFAETNVGASNARCMGAASHSDFSDFALADTQVQSLPKEAPIQARPPVSRHSRGAFRSAARSGGRRGGRKRSSGYGKGRVSTKDGPNNMNIGRNTVTASVKRAGRRGGIAAMPT